MLKTINKLETIYNGELIVDEKTKEEIKKTWDEFIKDKNPNEFFDGDIYCVTEIDDTIPLINISKTKFSYMIYSMKTNKIIIRSLFSASYVRTSDNYICIIMNNHDILNTIGGMADNRDINNNKYDCEQCLKREFKEEIGLDLNNENFSVTLKFLKYPSKKELTKSHYPVGTLFEIKTNYTKNEFIENYHKSKHENEVKELKFYNINNYKEVYSYDKKKEYIDELFRLLFE